MTTSSKINEQDLSPEMDLAKQTTLEEVQSDVTKVYNNALEIVGDTGTTLNRIGATGDTGGSDSAGTVMAKLNGIFNRVADNHTGSATGTLSQKITHVLNTLGVTGDTGGSATAGTVMGKLNALVGNTVTNNTASKTGVLSAKLAYVISLLENTTYGLSALKTASGSSVVKSVQRGVITLTGDISSTTATISSVNTSKAVVLYTGDNIDYAGSSLPAYKDHYYLELTNSTTVTAKCGTYAGTSKIIIPYQVIEFY